MNPVNKYNFGHPLDWNQPLYNNLALHSALHSMAKAPSGTSASSLIPNFVSKGRGSKVPVEKFNTRDELLLVQKQLEVTRSVDGKEFMLLLQKYTAAETDAEDFAALRATIPRYSVELASPNRSKYLYRGISVSERAALQILNLPRGYQGRESAHGIVHGMKLIDGSFSGHGVASASTVFAISEGFALGNAFEKKQVPVLLKLVAMGAVPEKNHSGAKGVTLNTSRLPIAAGGKSEHEVILDITNCYEIVNAYLEDGRVNVAIMVLGKSKRGVELALPETDKWTQISGAKGNTPGGLFQAPNSTIWYIKTGRSISNFRNELLASKLYAAAGINVPELRLALRGGQPALISKYIKGNPSDPVAMVNNQAFLKGFAVDVWLANWDVVGLNFDNVLLTSDKKPVRIDLGGSLAFRAGGERKGDAFTSVPMELITMLSSTENSSSVAFQKIKPSHIKAGISLIEQIPDSHIQALCMTSGPGNYTERAALSETIIERKKWLVSVKVDLPYIHPQQNESGCVVPIHHPTSPSPSADWEGATKAVTFVPHRTVDGFLNGTRLTDWRPPSTTSEWRNIRTRSTEFQEPAFIPNGHLMPASGAVILEPDGRVWLIEPTNHAFGVMHTFPKGKLDPGLNLRTNAVKEVYEETGLRIMLTAFLGDYDRTTSRTRYYLGKRIAGSPSAMGSESQSVKLVSLSKATELLNLPLDKKILFTVAHALK